MLPPALPSPRLYLSCRLDPLPDTEVDQHPAGQQTQGHLPVEGPRNLQPPGEPQDFVPGGGKAHEGCASKGPGDWGWPWGGAPPPPPPPQPLSPAGLPHAPGRPGPSLQPGVAAVCVPGALEPLAARPHAVPSGPSSSPPLPSPGGQAPPAPHPWPHPPRAGPRHTHACTCTHTHTHTHADLSYVWETRGLAGPGPEVPDFLPELDDRDLRPAGWSHVKLARLALTQTSKGTGLAWGLQAWLGNSYVPKGLRRWGAGLFGHAHWGAPATLRGGASPGGLMAKPLTGCLGPRQAG